MLVIFVFCRQKAAYELRISAWSSDVCSSDLRLDQLVSTARRMDETMAALLDPPRQPVDLSQLIERMAMEYGGICAGRGVRLRKSIAIGRASCGDRVCQYGYISVVDVSLKQYHLHHKTITLPHFYT